ncbi:MAG: response regulator [Candidatus Cloacimonetes bacterium]|nr:response regulator [Candidatus Cloacimonadota bacterium]
MRKKVKLRDNITTIMLVEDEEINLRLMEGMLGHLGHRLILARNGREAIKKFNKFQPDIVILDILMPRISGIEVLKEIRSSESGTIVIMVTASNKEEHAIESLRLGANNYLKKPVHYDDLVPLIHKYNSTIQKRTMEKLVLSKMVSRKFVMEIENDLQIIPKIAQYLANETSTIFDKDEIVSVNIALLELLVNAFEHGNLGISYQDKSKAIAEKRLEKLYAERLVDPRFSNRKIVIDFTLEKDACEWIITDEGEGFQSREYTTLNEDDRENEHGRGIFISNFHLDELEYIGKGNKVRALKKKK